MPIVYIYIHNQIIHQFKRNQRFIRILTRLCLIWWNRWPVCSWPLRITAVRLLLAFFLCAIPPSAMTTPCILMQRYGISVLATIDKSFEYIHLISNIIYFPSACCRINMSSISGFLWYVIIFSWPNVNLALGELQFKLGHRWILARSCLYIFIYIYNILSEVMLWWLWWCNYPSM